MTRLSGLVNQVGVITTKNACPRWPSHNQVFLAASLSRALGKVASMFRNTIPETLRSSDLEGCFRLQNRCYCAFLRWQWWARWSPAVRGQSLGGRYRPPLPRHNDPFEWVKELSWDGGWLLRQGECGSVGVICSGSFLSPLPPLPLPAAASSSPRVFFPPSSIYVPGSAFFKLNMFWRCGSVGIHLQPFPRLVFSVFPPHPFPSFTR